MADKKGWNFIMASDAQYEWTPAQDKHMNEYGDYAPYKGDPKTYAKKQVESFKEYKRIVEASKRDFKGIMMNGDLVDANESKTGKRDVDYFREIYENAISPFFVGLGNHDYENYVNDTYQNRGATDMVKCIRRNIYEHNPSYIKGAQFLKVDDFDTGLANYQTRYWGSYSYVIELDDVWIIQLNNSPHYTNEWSSYETATDNRRFPCTIINSLRWLEVQLYKAAEKNKAVIVCMHKPYTEWAKDFGKDKKKQKKEDELAAENVAAFQNLIEKYKVSAVFWGHVHDHIGYDMEIKNIPHFSCGSTSQRKYLGLHFSYEKQDGSHEGTMYVSRINSDDGNVTFMDTEKKEKEYSVKLRFNTIESCGIDKKPQMEKYIIFDQDATLVARCYVEYTLNGKKKKVNSGKKAKDSKHIFILPADSKKIKITAKYLNWYFSWKTIFKDESEVNCTYRVTGPAGDQKWKIKHEHKDEWF